MAWRQRRRSFTIRYCCCGCLVEHLLSETASSKIFVLEDTMRGQRIDVRRESVVAFVGAAPRGAVGMPVAIRSIDEFRRRFGSPGHRCAAQVHLAQFFENGGTNAVFVRVAGSNRRHRIVIGAPGDNLLLDAINPGPLECLRASVDYDGVEHDDERFNLVIHRLTSRDRPIVEEQEVYRGVSVNPDDSDFIAYILADSNLVSVVGRVPTECPHVTLSPGIEVGASYAYADENWHAALSLTDYDLIGSNTEGTGVFALDRLPILDLVCLVPNEGGVGPVALFAADRYCERRQAMLLVDPPSTWTNVNTVLSDRNATGFSSPNVMTYFPRPAPWVGLEKGELPSALGAIAGRLVAGDSENGVWAACAQESVAVRYRDRLGCRVDDHECAALIRKGINPLRECVRGYIQLDGLVTMGRNGGHDVRTASYAMQRLGLFIIGSIVRGTRWSAFEPDTQETWGEVTQQISQFLKELFEAGALESSGLRGASYIICDQETNSSGHRDSAGASRGVNFIVGFALRGHDFHTYRFSHDQFECRVHSGGWQLGVALAG